MVKVKNKKLDREKNPSLCIIGASSFIGRNLYGYLSSELDNFSIYGTYFSNKVNDDFEFLDITDKKSIEDYLLRIKPDFLLWLSSWKPAKCEQDYNSAIDFHVKSLINVLEIINRVGLDTKILFMSSDYVFNGREGLYTEKDIPIPRVNYGKLKRASEQLLLTLSTKVKVIRGSAVMGNGGVFFDWLLNEIEKDNEIVGFSDIYFSPTPMKFFMESMKKIIVDYEKISQSIIHIGLGERISRYEFIRLVSSIVGGNPSKIVPRTKESVKNDDSSNESLFEKDISLIPSDFIRPNTYKPLRDWIKEEIKG